LVPGEMKTRLASSLGTAFPVRVAFSTVRDTVPVLGRTHPGVSTLCEAALGQAFAGQPDALFARTGAMRTDAVRLRTVLLLLRLRYTLEEEVEEFAEEIVLAAFERRDGRLHWLEPLENAGREIAAAARPVGNVGAAEKAEQIGWALEFIVGTPEWHAPIVAARVAELEAAHARLRRLTKLAPGRNRGRLASKYCRTSRRTFSAASCSSLQEGRFEPGRHHRRGRPARRRPR
jgi:hypothetical protein